MSDPVKIVQVLTTPNTQRWQDTLLGLGENGVLYFLNSEQEWEWMADPPRPQLPSQLPDKGE